MTNIEFAYPWVLLALLLVPALAVLLFVPSLRKLRRGSFVLPTAASFERAGKGWRHWARQACNALVLVALALLIIAMARPQAVHGRELNVEGIDIFLALDMSGSMQAVDASKAEVTRLQNRGKKPPNRFQSAVSTLRDFVKSRKHDRIGMAVFAKDAFLQFPLTLDYRTILKMLDRLELGDIDEGGTAIGNALGRAVAGLKDSEARTKIVILITDGDRRGGNISPMEAAELAADQDIKVFPILVGNDGPTLIPVKVHSLFGGQGVRYREQKFPVNPQLLKDLADKTDGSFYRASDGEGLEKRLHDILDRFERTQLNDSATVRKTERFEPFLLAALLLFGLQFSARYTVLRPFP